MSIKSKFALPFSVKTNSAVTGGYVDRLHSEFYKETEIANYHEDDVGDTNNDDLTSTLQSPITNDWVGGREHRHVPLTKYEAEDYFEILGIQEERNFEDLSVMSYVSDDDLLYSNEYSLIKTGSLGIYQNSKFFVFGAQDGEDRILEFQRIFTGSVEINISALINRNFFYTYSNSSFDEGFESGWAAPGQVGNYTFTTSSFDEGFESEWSAPGEIGTYQFTTSSFDEDFESW